MPRSPLQRVPGWMWMVVCAAMFCTSGALTKQAVVGHKANIFWVGWARYVLSTAAMTLPALFGAWSLRVRNRSVFVWRGVVGSTGQFLSYVAVAYVGLGRGTVLSYLMGLFGAVAGVFLLRERPKVIMLVALVAGTAGVFLTCGAALPAGAEWAGVGCALLSGTTLALVRLLRRTDTNQVTFLSQGIFGSLLLLAPTMLSPMPVEASTWGIIVLLTAAGIVGQLTMTQGLATVTVARGGTLMMLTPIFSVVVGLVLFGESITLIEGAGCALVLAASTTAIVRR